MSGDNTVLIFALAIATFWYGSRPHRQCGVAVGTQLGFLVAGYAPSM